MFQTGGEWAPPPVAAGLVSGGTSCGVCQVYLEVGVVEDAVLTGLCVVMEKGNVWI